MKLSKSELSFVKREQKRQRQWRWARWVNAAVSLIVAISSAAGMRRLLELSTGQDDGENLMAWFFPFCWFVLLSFSGWFVYTLIHWRGDLRNALLLRLVEEHEEEHRN